MRSRLSRREPRLRLLGFAAAFATQGSAQEFSAPQAAPVEVSPNPRRPVADIVSPIWHFAVMLCLWR